VFPVAIRAADPGEARAGVAAIEVAADDFPDDRLEISVFPLEAPLVFDEEPLEMMEQHAVEDHALRTSRTVDSRHIAKADSKSVPAVADLSKDGGRNWRALNSGFPADIEVNCLIAGKSHLFAGTDCGVWRFP